MRSLVRLLGVCALVLIPFFACMDSGDGEAEGCGPYSFDLDGDSCSGVVCPSDGNECTVEYCSDGTCKSRPVTNGTSCTYDGISGVCVWGECGENLCEGVDCNDDNACTDDACDYVDGLCDHTPVPYGTSCDDGDDEECTADFCIDGRCVGAGTEVPNGTRCTYDGLDGVCVDGVCGENLCEDVDCDDQNDCTQDACDYVDGLCDHTSFPDGTTCVQGFCATGECKPVEPVEPLESCAQVLEQEPTAPSGIYNLNLGFDTPMPVYCEMDREGGGWTLVASMNGWDFCGADPLPEYDLLSDPAKTNGKIPDAVVRGIRAGSGRYDVMYYLGLPGRSEYLFTQIQSSWSTRGGDLTHCNWTCADGNADSTTCEDESLGCGFGGSGTAGDTKKLYLGFNGGLHSGGGFCGLDNRPFYPVQVFAR